MQMHIWVESVMRNDVHPANMFVRRIFAWPICLLGAILVTVGGGLIRLGAWATDLDTSAIS